ADLTRWMPVVKWLLAIPHYIVLFFLDIAAVVVIIVAWFAILFTGRYPRGMFDFVAGVIRWHNRVIGYALTLVTDRRTTLSLAPCATVVPVPGRATRASLVGWERIRPHAMSSVGTRAASPVCRSR